MRGRGGEERGGEGRKREGKGAKKSSTRGWGTQGINQIDVLRHTNLDTNSEKLIWPLLSTSMRLNALFAKGVSSIWKWP